VVPYRVQCYKVFSSRLGANVLAIDYRGFGDSEGVPSESGLAKDAQAAWDWLIFNGANPEDILIVGHSLGTAVAAKLAVDLTTQGVTFKGVTLMSPFSSIRTLLEAYHFFGVLPLMKPLGLIPGAYGSVTLPLSPSLI
jgi:abhydrolase domain-containing protein 12